MTTDGRTRAATPQAEWWREYAGIEAITIDEVLEVFKGSSYLSLAKKLRGRLLDSVLKILDARDPRTRNKHAVYVEAFLEACKARGGQAAQVPLFENAFPKEAKEKQLFEAARHLLLLMRQKAHDLRLPLPSMHSTPTIDQLRVMLEATTIIKASAEHTFGHPMLRQLRARGGWTDTEIQAALQRKGYTADQAASIVRNPMRPRRGAKKRRSGTGD